jgi:hypothetical protein
MDGMKGKVGELGKECEQEEVNGEVQYLGTTQNKVFNN